MSEATDGWYGKTCRTYAILAIIPSFFTIFFLCLYSKIKLAESKNAKQEKGDHFFITKNISLSRKLNLNEKMCWINVLVGVVHSIMNIDQRGWHGWGPIWMRTTMSGFLTAAAIHIAITLVTGWITLIDGGKAKKTPQWAVNLKRFCYFGLYVIETVLGNLQYHVGMSANYEMYMDGTVVAIKNGWYCFTVLIYAFVGLHYGRKITQQLRTGSRKKSASEKRLKRYCYMEFSLMFLAFWWKCLPTWTWEGRSMNWYAVIPCKVSYSSAEFHGLVMMGEWNPPVQPSLLI